MWNLVVPALASLAGGWLAGEGDRKAGEAQADAADQNVALQREVYQDQRALAAPSYLTGGAAANKLANAFGIAPQDYSAALGGGSSNGSQWNAYLAANPDVMAEWTRISSNPGNTFKDSADFAQQHYLRHGQAEGRALPAAPGGSGTTPNALADPMAEFSASPYGKIATSGFRGVDVPEINGAYARGGKVLSGAQSIALDERGKARLGGAYNDYTNGLRSLAGMNQTASSQIGGAAGTYGANTGNALTAAGDAKANALSSSYKGIGQGISGALGAVNEYGQKNWGWS